MNLLNFIIFSQFFGVFEIFPTIFWKTRISVHSSAPRPQFPIWTKMVDFEKRGNFVAKLGELPNFNLADFQPNSSFFGFNSK